MEVVGVCGSLPLGVCGPTGVCGPFEDTDAAAAAAAAAAADAGSSGLELLRIFLGRSESLSSRVGVKSPPPFGSGLNA